MFRASVSKKLENTSWRGRGRSRIRRSLAGTSDRRGVRSGFRRKVCVTSLDGNFRTTRNGSCRNLLPRTPVPSSLHSSYRPTQRNNFDYALAVLERHLLPRPVCDDDVSRVFRKGDQGTGFPQGQQFFCKSQHLSRERSLIHSPVTWTLGQIRFRAFDEFRSTCVLYVSLCKEGNIDGSVERNTINFLVTFSNN